MTSLSFQILSNSQFNQIPPFGAIYSQLLKIEQATHYTNMWNNIPLCDKPQFMSTRLMFLFGLYIKPDVAIILKNCRPTNSCSTQLIICNDHHINMSWLRRHGLDNCRDEATDQRQVCMVKKLHNLKTLSPALHTTWVLGRGRSYLWHR
jgi:hypothetical protein